MNLLLTPPNMLSSKSAMFGIMIILTTLAPWNIGSTSQAYGFQNAAAPKPQTDVYAGTMASARVPTILRDTSSSSNSGNNADDDDEIAKLEEQLKKLKQDKAAAQGTLSSPVPAQGLDSINSGLSSEEVPIEMFLSEGWKEKDATQDGSDGGGAILASVLGAVALAVFLAVFAQVPIGQEDLSKYSAIRAPTEQIDLGDLNRARSSGQDI